MLRLNRLSLPLGLLLLASLACSVDLGSTAPTPAASPVAVLKDLGFEAPADGSQLPFGPVEVKTYAWVDVGITQAELDINGVALRTDPVTNEKVNGEYALTRITQFWTPPGPGTYTLSVRVQDTLGNWYVINTITVHILDASTATATATLPANNLPSETPSASPAASATLPRITFTPSATLAAGGASATNTSTATVTVAAAAVGTPFTTFSADSTSINAGQCTTLRWTSGNIQSIFLDNQPATGTENRQVCPSTSTTYILRANSTSGEITKQVTITVNVGSGPFTTFIADSTTLNAGQCTTLRWTSGNIQSIFLDNQPVTGAENRQVCPTAPTTYILRANSTSGEITKQVTIQVNGGAPFVNFSADSTTLNAGQCTMLHWTSGNITAIFLNNEGTVGTLDKQVCPTTTTLYKLRATTASSGDIVKEITITVSGSAPALAPAPVYNFHSASVSEFTNSTACIGNKVTISTSISNATGVIINYRVDSGGPTRSQAMSNAGGDTWNVVIRAGDGLDVASEPTGRLLYTFNASNASGSVSFGAFSAVTLIKCPE